MHASTRAETDLEYYICLVFPQCKNQPDDENSMVGCTAAVPEAINMRRNDDLPPSGRNTAEERGLVVLLS
jgi:hypothetical protein